jgi:hypothetical protein
MIPHVHVLHPVGAIKRCIRLMFKIAPGDFVEPATVAGGNPAGELVGLAGFEPATKGL